MSKTSKLFNRKGFTSTDVFVVVSIAIILLVIVFMTLNTLIEKYQIATDIDRGREIASAIKTMLISTGITDVTVKNTFLSKKDNETIKIEANEEGVKTLIEMLQEGFKIIDPRTGRPTLYEPFLTMPENAKSSYENYAPQWNPSNKGEHLGYLIKIWVKDQTVEVTPITNLSKFTIKIY